MSVKQQDKPRPFVAEWNEALGGDIRLSATDIAICRALMVFMKADGHCYPGRHSLKWHSHIGLVTLSRQIQHVEKLGWIEVDRRGIGRNRRTARYQALIPEVPPKCVNPPLWDDGDEETTDSVPEPVPETTDSVPEPVPETTDSVPEPVPETTDSVPEPVPGENDQNTFTSRPEHIHLTTGTDSPAERKGSREGSREPNPAVVDAALEILATHQAGGRGDNPVAYKAKILERLTGELGDRARSYVDRQPGISASALAAALTSSTPVAKPSPLDGTVAAQRRTAEANAKRAAETANEPRMTPEQLEALRSFKIGLAIDEVVA